MAVWVEMHEVTNQFVHFGTIFLAVVIDIQGFAALSMVELRRGSPQHFLDHKFEVRARKNLGI